MMYDHSNKIKELTKGSSDNGYEIGLLFEESINNQIDCYNGNGEENQEAEGCIYNSNTNDFHMIPNDENKFYEISAEIYKKRSALKDYITIKRPDYKDKIAKGEGVKGNIRGLTKKSHGHYKNEGGLFRYLRLVVNGNNHDIVFIRFYTAENESTKTVNCILKCLQFCSEIKNKDVRCYNKEKVFYPKTEAGESFLRVNNKVYYNPKASFFAEEKVIFDEFIEYIENVEKG